MLEYIDDIALRRFAEGFEPDEIYEVLSVFHEIISSELFNKKELKSLKQDINDYIWMTIQLAKDGIEDLYETLDQKYGNDINSALLTECQEIQIRARQLSVFIKFSQMREIKI